MFNCIRVLTRNKIYLHVKYFQDCDKYIELPMQNCVKL